MLHETLLVVLSGFLTILKRATSESVIRDDKILNEERQYLSLTIDSY